jgi:hypothetical protein
MQDIEKNTKDTMQARIKEDVTQLVHQRADQADWMHLNIPQRQKYYEEWTADPQIGGLLSQTMHPSHVRVYLKDTIMKTYSRNQRPDIRALLTNLSIPCAQVTRELIKPQALLCGRTRLYTLAPAKDWKIAIMSAFERACEFGSIKENVVFITEHTAGRFIDKKYRDMINAAARRLDVTVHWLT